jgi:chaperonin cofactor prefoldin
VRKKKEVGDFRGKTKETREEEERNGEEAYPISSEFERYPTPPRKTGVLLLKSQKKSWHEELWHKNSNLTTRGRNINKKEKKNKPVLSVIWVSIRAGAVTTVGEGDSQERALDSSGRRK